MSGTKVTDALNVLLIILCFQINLHVSVTNFLLKRALLLKQRHSLLTKSEAGV